MMLTFFQNIVVVYVRNTGFLFPLFLLSSLYSEDSDIDISISSKKVYLFSFYLLLDGCVLVMFVSVCYYVLLILGV